MPSLEPRCIGTLNKNQAPAYLVTAYSTSQQWWPTGLFQYYTAQVQCYELFWFINDNGSVHDQTVFASRTDFNSGNQPLFVVQLQENKNDVIVIVQFRTSGGGQYKTSALTLGRRSAVSGQWWHTIVQFEPNATQSADNDNIFGDNNFHVYHGRTGVNVAGYAVQADSLYGSNPEQLPNAYLHQNVGSVTSTSAPYLLANGMAGFRQLANTALPYTISVGCKLNGTQLNVVPSSILDGGVAELRVWGRWWSPNPTNESVPSPSQLEARRNVYVRHTSVSSETPTQSVSNSWLRHCLRFNDAPGTAATGITYVGQSSSGFDGAVSGAFGIGFASSPIIEPYGGTIRDMTASEVSLANASFSGQGDPAVVVLIPFPATGAGNNAVAEEDATISGVPSFAVAGDNSDTDQDDAAWVRARAYQPDAVDADATEPDGIADLNRTLSTNNTAFPDRSRSENGAPPEIAFNRNMAADDPTDSVLSDNNVPYVGVTVSVAATGAGNDSSGAEVGQPTLTISGVVSLYNVLAPSETATQDSADLDANRVLGVVPGDASAEQDNAVLRRQVVLARTDGSVSVQSVPTITTAGQKPMSSSTTDLPVTGANDIPTLARLVGSTTTGAPSVVVAEESNKFVVQRGHAATSDGQSSQDNPSLQQADDMGNAGTPSATISSDTPVLLGRLRPLPASGSPSQSDSAELVTLDREARMSVADASLDAVASEDNAASMTRAHKSTADTTSANAIVTLVTAGEIPLENVQDVTVVTSADDAVTLLIERAATASAAPVATDSSQSVPNFGASRGIAPAVQIPAATTQPAPVLRVERKAAATSLGHRSVSEQDSFNFARLADFKPQHPNGHRTVSSQHTPILQVAGNPQLSNTIDPVPVLAAESGGFAVEKAMSGTALEIGSEANLITAAPGVIRGMADDGLGGTESNQLQADMAVTPPLYMSNAGNASTAFVTQSAGTALILKPDNQNTPSLSRTLDQSGNALLRRHKATSTPINARSTQLLPIISVAGEIPLTATNTEIPSSSSESLPSLSISKDFSGTNVALPTESFEIVALGINRGREAQRTDISTFEVRPVLERYGVRPLTNQNTPSSMLSDEPPVFMARQVVMSALQPGVESSSFELAPVELTPVRFLGNAGNPAAGTSDHALLPLTISRGVGNPDDPALVQSEGPVVDWYLDIVLSATQDPGSAATVLFAVLEKNTAIPFLNLLQNETGSSDQFLVQAAMTRDMGVSDPPAVISDQPAVIAPARNVAMSAANEPGSVSFGFSNIETGTTRFMSNAVFNAPATSGYLIPDILINRDYVPPADAALSSGPTARLAVRPELIPRVSSSSSAQLPVILIRSHGIAATSGLGSGSAASATIIRQRGMLPVLDDSSGTNSNPPMAAGSLEGIIDEIESVTVYLCSLEDYLSKLDIWNVALTKLGLETLTATTDNVAQAVAMAANWPSFKGTFLRDHVWNGAYTSVELAKYQNTVTPGDVNPVGPWKYAYRLDNLTPHWVRSIRLNGRENQPGTKTANGIGLWEEKVIFNDAGAGAFCLVTNEASATLDYVFMVQDCDIDMYLPEDMRWAMALTFAVHMASDLGSSNADVALLEQQAEMARRNARRTDGQSAARLTLTDYSIHDAFY
jgi:hypothetical protein